MNKKPCEQTMKKTILFYFLFITNLCICQVKNGYIQYGIVINKEFSGNELKEKDIIEAFRKANEAAEKVEYTLNFNGGEAYFFANPVLSQTNIPLSGLVTIGGGKLKYYQNDKTKEYREFLDSKKVGIAILNRQIKYEWTLLNESKMIDGYTCYKATSPVMHQKNNFKSTDPKFNITAWYAPEIPVSFGPVGYGGLPGLILELQFYTQTFYAKKTNLNLDKTPEIDKLTEPKAISEETYMEMYRGTLNKAQLEATQE
jgi:GLPGLI family protein